MIYFCPVCWKEIPSDASTCLHCSSDVHEADSLPFVTKLISALHHSEPQTAVRAAWILGERHETDAVTELIHVLETAADGFLAEAAAEALGKIGNPRALVALRGAAECGPIRVRLAARGAIEKIGEAES